MYSSSKAAYITVSELHEIDSRRSRDKLRLSSHNNELKETDSKSCRKTTTVRWLITVLYACFGAPCAPIPEEIKRIWCSHLRQVGYEEKNWRNSDELTTPSQLSCFYCRSLSQRPAQRSVDEHLSPLILCVRQIVRHQHYPELPGSACSVILR